MKYILCAAFVLFSMIGCPQTKPALRSIEPEAETITTASAAHESPDETLVVANGKETPVPMLKDPDALPEEKIIVQDDENKTAPVLDVTEKEVWTPLFDGESTVGWAVPVYGGDGEVDVQEGNLVIGRGEQMTGIQYKKEFPKIDYELRYEARRTEGYDFFAACTFPVKDDCCTFVNGGWGGGAIGLSSVNGYDASENETTGFFDFKEKTWYRFRILVKENKIQVWITPQDKEGKWEEEKSLIDLDVDEDTRLSTRLEMDQYKPLGFCTWSTEGRLRNIEWRKL